MTATPASFQARSLSALKTASDRRAKALFSSLLSSVFCLSRYKEEDHTRTWACLRAIAPLTDRSLEPVVSGRFLRLGDVCVVAISQDEAYLQNEAICLAEQRDSVCPALVASLSAVFEDCLAR